MLSSAGSLLVTWSAARQPGPTFVFRLSTGPFRCLLLQHTTVCLHAKQPTQCYKMSRSALYLHALVCNDSANSAAIVDAYLYFYGITAVKPGDISLLLKSRWFKDDLFFVRLILGVNDDVCSFFISMHMCYVLI